MANEPGTIGKPRFAGEIAAQPVQQSITGLVLGELGVEKEFGCTDRPFISGRSSFELFGSEASTGCLCELLLRRASAGFSFSSVSEPRSARRARWALFFAGFDGH